MLKLRRVLEYYDKNKYNDTDHVIFPDERPPLDYSSECWCEPRVITVRNFTMWGKKYPGYSKIILHTGKWFKPTFSPTNKTDALYRSLQEPPEGGWDRAMDQERVDSLLEDVLKYEYKRATLVQRKGESMNDYYHRVKAAINSGIHELRYETNDPDALSELLARDDDFEIEIDEEE